MKTIIALQARVEAPPPAVDGRRILVTIALALAAGATLGSATFFALRAVTNSGVTGQVITVEVYACLVASLAFAFRPVRQAPLAFCYKGARDLPLAFLTWLASMVAGFVVYLALRPITGNPLDALRRVLSVATDAKHLQGQPLLAWFIAIPRGLLLAPAFEELMFRGLLLDWLRQRLSIPNAIIVSSLAFAAMHVYPVVMPYAFFCGLFTGWLRLRTGSTFNTLFVHTLNNVLFLILGLSLVR